MREGKKCEREEERRTTENSSTYSPSHHLTLPQMRQTTDYLPTKWASTNFSPTNEEKVYWQVWTFDVLHGICSKRISY